MSRPARITCALFDFDGVVVDSEPRAAVRNQRIFQQLGAPATYEDCITLAGKSGSVEIPAILAKYGSSATFEDFVALHDDPETPEIYLDPELRVFDGLRDLLAAIRETGVRTGLVSTTSSRRILVALDRFGLVSSFDAIVCGDMVERRKPDPEPYVRAMGILGARPSETCVFEDSPTGVAAGKASGAYVFGVCVSSVVQDVSRADERINSYAAFDLGGFRG